MRFFFMEHCMRHCIRHCMWTPVRRRKSRNEFYFCASRATNLAVWTQRRAGGHTMQSRFCDVTCNVEWKIASYVRNPTQTWKEEKKPNNKKTKPLWNKTIKTLSHYSHFQISNNTSFIHLLFSFFLSLFCFLCIFFRGFFIFCFFILVFAFLFTLFLFFFFIW